MQSAVQFPGCSGNDKHCTSFPEDMGKRVLNEDCHHSHHHNRAKMTCLSPGFYQCSQRQTVCEKSFHSADSRAGGRRMHSSVFPYIALERELCSGKDSPQRANRDFQHGGGGRITTSLSCLLYKQHTEKCQRKLTHPKPTYLAYIFWVWQIQASDLTVISLMLSYFHLHHPEKKKKRCTTSCGKVPLFSWSIWQILWWRQLFYIICMLLKCIFLFSTEGLGIQQRGWPLLFSMAENKRNGNQKSLRERKFKWVPESLHFNTELLCVWSLMYAQFCACILKDTQRFTVQCGTCMVVTAWYITASSKIKVSLFWAILYSTICASSIDLLMMEFMWYWTMKEYFSLGNMEE